MLVAFDTPSPTFRHEAYEEYKAHRPVMPDDLQSQTPLARELVKVLGLASVEVPGFEADDCVGTAALRAERAGYEVLIVTGDSDALQLVRPGVNVLITRRGVTDTALYDPDAVEARYGLRPDQMVDYKALKGDSSDNVPGVKGIGEKTATRLIQQFGTLEELYRRIDEVPSARERQLLEAGTEMAHLSKELVTIHTEVTCEVDPDDCGVDRADLSEVREFLTRLEFRALLSRLEPLISNKGDAPAEPSRPEHALQVTRVSDALPREILTALDAGRPLCLALDLDGANGLTARLRGLAVSVDPAHAFYLPAESAALKELGPWLEREDLPKHGHDLKTQREALQRLGITLGAGALDTMVAAYVLRPEHSSPSLASLCSEYLDRELSTAKHGAQLMLDVGDEGADRVGAEAACVVELAPLLAERLREGDLWAVYEQMERPLIPILADMETRGVRLDIGVLESLSLELNEGIRALEQEIYALAGTEFNIGSPKQLQVILFEQMGLPRGRKTKTGYSTGVEVLEELAGEFEVVSKILNWRELSKLKSTYTDALIRLVSPRTGRVHTSLNQTVAATGRLSSSEPNLQNIPIRTEVGRRIRRAFVVEEGCRIVSADYSQIELRVLAHMTGDPELTRAFAADEDIHRAAAVRIFEVPPEEVTPEMRRRAKTVNFAVLYGMGDFTLARELGIPVASAKEYIQNYFDGFPSVRAFQEDTLRSAREKGYVCTLLGRRRYFSDINAANRQMRSYAERAAINSPIQGSAADIIKLAMVYLDARLKQEGLKGHMVLQVHDELVLEAPEEEALPLAEVVREEMERAYALHVPLKVDVKTGINWGELEPVG
jgi:DNA polymerase-1